MAHVSDPLNTHITKTPPWADCGRYRSHFAKIAKGTQCKAQRKHGAHHYVFVLHSYRGGCLCFSTNCNIRSIAIGSRNVKEKPDAAQS